MVPGPASVEARTISSVEDLVQVFVQAAKPRAGWRVGAEHEKIGVLSDTAAAVPFEGPRSLTAVFDALAARGFERISEAPGGPIIALRRAELSVTLEPGGQVELSGAPHRDIAAIEREISSHIAELETVSRPLGITWLGVGFRPFGTLDAVPWVPKGRYAVMRAYLPGRGRLAHEMMKRTATVQANLDWEDEADAARKLRAGMSIASVVTAMFAASPLVDGRDSGFDSFRAAVWLETDPDRCGLLPFAFEDGPVFRRYVEWALDVPLFFLRRDGVYRPAGGRSFRQFMAGAIEGETATMDDWEVHLSTLFPEVRFRHYLEVRGADAGPRELVLALPALWKGLLYDDAACRSATELLAHLTFADRVALREAVPRAGLGAPVPRRGTTRDVARELVSLAETGLRGMGAGEEKYLAPLAEIVATGRNPAARIRDALAKSGGDPARAVAALAL